MSQFFNSLGRNFGRNQNRKGDKKPPPIPTGSNGQGIPAQPSAGWAPNTSATGKQTMRPLMLCQPFVKASLLKGSFKTIVVLPKYVDEGEWIALNVFEFFDYLNRFYGVVTEFCTVRNCPSMSAGPGLDYSWLDANRQPTRLPAPTYIEYVMTWINNRLNDETVFPTKATPTTTASLITPSAHSANNSGASTPVAGQPGNWIGKEGGFPPSFFQTCKAIYKQMFRVFAHIYHTHFDKIVHLSLEAHWNSFFAHFIHFAREFELLEKRDMEPLKELIDAFDAQIAANSSTNKAT